MKKAVKKENRILPFLKIQRILFFLLVFSSQIQLVENTPIIPIKIDVSFLSFRQVFADKWRSECCGSKNDCTKMKFY